MQQVEPGLRVRADKDGVGRHAAGGAELLGRGDIDFVEDGEDAFRVGAELLEHLDRRRVVLFDVGVGDVEHVDQEVGNEHFFQGGLEGFHEAVRQSADEAHGIGDEQFLIVAQDELAGGRIERGEEFVLGEDVCAGERVEQGGFAGVGVADDGRGGHGHAQALAALRAALLPDFDELALEAGDAIADDAAILLELGFAFAAHGATAALAGEMGPGSREAWQGILHAGEGDLEDGFAGVRAVGEDFEDDFLAVDDGEAGKLLPVALLGGREGFVEDNQLGAELLGAGDELVGFAGAEQGAGGVGTQVDEILADDLVAQIFNELDELVEQFGAFAGGHLGSLHADKKGAVVLVAAFGF